MKAKAIPHIAVCVRNLDRSLEFYRDILDMTVTMDAVQDTSTGSRATPTSTAAPPAAWSTWVGVKAPSPTW